MMHQQEHELERYWRVRKYTIDKTRLICGGLIIVGIYFVQVFISSGILTSSKEFDWFALGSVLAFALALPLLAARLLLTFEEASRKYTVTHKKELIYAYRIGVISASVGIVLAFWHIGWFAGLLILASIVAGFWIYTDYGKKLNRLDKALKDKDDVDNLKEEES